MLTVRPKVRTSTPRATHCKVQEICNHYTPPHLTYESLLAISPNNRMPAIVDPEGPDGEPISIFESGAILQYLARKTGKLCGANQRERIEIDQWLFWQMAGVGPMAGAFAVLR